MYSTDRIMKILPPQRYILNKLKSLDIAYPELSLSEEKDLEEIRESLKEKSLKSD